MPRNLWEEAPEASEFANETIRNIEDYKLFPKERFAKLITAILSTTEKDTQGQVMTVDALKQIIKQIDAGKKILGAEHNPKIQTIGRIVSAKLFYAAKSKIHFIGAIIGYYSVHEIRSFRSHGIEFNNLDSPWSIKPEKITLESYARISFSPFEIDPAVIHSLLSSAPPFVNRIPLRKIRKAADPLMIITISLSINLILGPFLKEYFGTLGKAAAKKTSELLKWIKDEVIREVFEKKDKSGLLTFEFYYDDCIIIFVLEKYNQMITNQAVDSLPAGLTSALSLIAKMKHLEPKKMVFEFSNKIMKWLPTHGFANTTGVIAEHPVQIDPAIYRGMSIEAQENVEDEEC